MFSFIKTLFDQTYHTTQVRQAIIDCSSARSWFTNHFSSPNNLLEIQENQTHQAYILLLSFQIREAILKDYLISKNYIAKLALKSKQLVFTDSYGDTVYDDWHREVQSFTQRRELDIISYLVEFTPKVLTDELKFIGNWSEYVFEEKLDVEELWSVIAGIIDDTVLCYEPIQANLDTSDPYEYEKLVASELCNLGWNASPTAGSGDQGADVVAEKCGLRFVIQCKLYNQPVGNKAVQEVTSAKEFYEANGAAVITNSDYTKSARQLAESQAVWLLHDSQLNELNKAIEEMAEK